MPTQSAHEMCSQTGFSVAYHQVHPLPFFSNFFPEIGFFSLVCFFFTSSFQPQQPYPTSTTAPTTTSEQYSRCEFCLLPLAEQHNSMAMMHLMATAPCWPRRRTGETATLHVRRRGDNEATWRGMRRRDTLATRGPCTHGNERVSRRPRRSQHDNSKNSKPIKGDRNIRHRWMGNWTRR